MQCIKIPPHVWRYFCNAASRVIWGNLADLLDFFVRWLY